MKSFWAKVIKFFVDILKLSTIPPEVNGADENILRWWEVYRSKSPWLSYDYITAAGKKRNRRRLSLNMAKVACSEMAGLVLAEPPVVEAGALVEKLIEKEKLWDNLRRNLEWQGATGGQVLKVCIGSEGEGVEKKNVLSLDYIKAMSFIPLAWDNTEITEGSFLDRRVINKKTLVRVETHKKGVGGKGYVITQKVFDEQTGLEVPLSQFNANLEEETILPNLSMPLFAYVRNPEANNIEPESPLGMSLFANAMDTLQALDIAFDGMNSDVIFGKPRVALPGTVMRGYFDQDGIKQVGFDPNEEIFLRLEGDDADKMKPVDLSTTLHPEEYLKYINGYLNIFAMQTGFDAGYFTFDGVSVKTATEVISDNSHTFKTMQGFRANLSEGLIKIFKVVNELGAFYKIEGADKSKIPAITWDDSVIEDRNSKATYWTDLVNSKLVDKATALMKIHGLDETKAAEMAEKIGKETATVTADSIFPREV